MVSVNKVILIWDLGETPDASRVTGVCIQFYNHRWQHQALAMRTPAQAYALAA